MFALRLTSDASLHGLDTDDGFTIGAFSAATIFLLGVTALLGAIGGIVYLVVRAWIPPRLRPWVIGTLAGVGGGALVLRPGGLDFTRLEPLGLAVAMFVALPALYGVVLAVWIERLLRAGSVMERRGVWIAGLLPLLPLALLGGIGIGVALLALAAWAIGRTYPSLLDAWHSAVVTWIGRAVLVVVGVLGFVELAQDTVEIL
jgi:hypothetical protein